MRDIYYRHIHVVCSVFIMVISLLSNRCCCRHYQYEACAPKNCGNKSISFPFYIAGLQPDYCGSPGFNITCENNTYSLLRIPEDNQSVLIEEIFYHSRTVRVSSTALRSNAGSCGVIKQFNSNLTLDSGRLNLSNDSRLVLLWNCSQKASLDKYRVKCDGQNSVVIMNDKDRNLDVASRLCMLRVETPIIFSDDQTITSMNYLTVLRKGFLLKWTATDCTECNSTDGRCGRDIERDQFLCFCQDRPHYKNCTASKTEDANNKKVILVTAISGASFVLVICLVTIIWKGCGNIFITFLSKKTSSDIDDNISYFGVPIFSYKDLEEATHRFDSSKELGDGGYGTVYYGKLKDGREVAVKRLYENNFKRQEQFMNEIEILTRLRHRNLVLLYGSTSHRSHELLLVYEYIPNGTVADHLHGDRAENEPLTWHVRMHIAMETASALAYLHKSDIIHRDVKTNNILLDKNFTVKVADFGLSRLFPTAATHVSTAPQGTPGYVDPEYHQCYQLTDKSDVYSFGVVLIELISSMPAVDISRSRNEINLANLAVNRIQKCAFDELIDPSLGYKSDPTIERMTTSVAELAFRCLQLEKELRPTMDEVYECLVQIMAVDESKIAKPQPSPESENVVLLKNKTFPASPVTVIDNWISSRSTTQSTSEL